MRFMLQGRVYEAAAIDRVSLGDLLRLEAETDALGRPMKWRDMRAIMDRMQDVIDDDASTDDDLIDHPDFGWFLGLLVWASRLTAGEPITFAEAIDFPIGELEFLDDVKKRKKTPKDRQPKKDATEDPRRARAGSGRADGARPARAASRARTTAKSSATASSGD